MSVTMINVNGCNRYEEARAHEALKPGHFLELVQTTGKVKKQTNTGKPGMLAFACEDSLQGKTVNDAYAEGDLVRYRIPKAGDKFYARLAAGATAVLAYDNLTVSSDGTVKKATYSAGSNVPFVVAEEAVDNSGGSSEVFILVRAI